MLTGKLVLEQFGYMLSDVEFPMFDTRTGKPTGQTQRLKVLGFQALDKDLNPSGVEIELRLNPADFDLFLQGLRGQRVQTATPQDLQALGLNGVRSGYEQR